MPAETKRRYTLDEYLALERASDARLEFKQEDGSWSYTEINGLESSVHLPSLGVTLRLSDIYQNVEFETCSGPTALLSERLEFYL